MRRPFIHRPTPATVIACLALAIALGGTSFAAVGSLINGSQIKPHTIAKNRLTAAAISDLRGNRGPIGPRGIRGPAGIQHLTAVVKQVSVSPNSSGEAIATCPSGQSAVSGGSVFGGDLIVTVSTGNGWLAHGYNYKSAAEPIVAVAYCSPNVTVTLPPGG
jgi:hypothetical protein